MNARLASRLVEVGLRKEIPRTRTNIDQIVYITEGKLESEQS